jgi:hypothetical protein
VWLPPHASHKLQPLDVGPFSSLANHYGKAVQKYTPTGFATINRATFTTLYQEVRPKAITERNIRAGWKRSGLWPLNRARIAEDPEIKNFGRTTPEYQPPQQCVGQFDTPKKLQDYEDLAVQVEAVTTPSKHVPIRKLIHGAVHELTANHILANDLREIRSHAVTKEIQKRSARFKRKRIKGPGTLIK